MSYYVQINKLTGNEDVNLPCKMSEQASGYDLYAAVAGEIVLAPGERALIPTGISLAMPEGLEAQIRPRSGLALKHGITCLNTPGTIDADYRGEIKVLLINLGQEPLLSLAMSGLPKWYFKLFQWLIWWKWKSCPKHNAEPEALVILANKIVDIIHLKSLRIHAQGMIRELFCYAELIIIKHYFLRLLCR